MTFFDFLQNHWENTGVVAVFFIPLAWFLIRYLRTTADKLGKRLDEAHSEHLADMRGPIQENAQSSNKIACALDNLTMAIGRCPIR